jgi:replicative DNA helicase
MHQNSQSFGNSELFNIDAEQQIIGVILRYPASFDSLPHQLEARDFSPKHNRIFSAMSEIILRTGDCDAVTLAMQLGDDCLDYLIDLTTNTLGGSNLTAYADAVVKKSIDREILAFGRELENLAHTPMETDKKLGLISDRCQSLERTGGDEGEEMDSMLKSTIAAIDLRFRTKELQGLKTGFADLDAKTSGLQPADLVIIAGRPSMGKAQPLYSKVLLSNGLFTTMGEIKVGDSLASEDGEESFVVGVFPQGVRPVYRVTLDDGRTVDADEEHLWAAYSTRWACRNKTVSTKELIYYSGKARYKNRLFLESHTGDFGGGSLPLDPWLLGAMIGDGGITGGACRFSNQEEYMIAKFNALHDGGLKKVAGDNVDYYVNGGMKSALRSVRLLGLASHQKFIPEIYFSASKFDRERLLAGLIETDGWIEKTGSVQYSTSSEVLANDICKLVCSLGGSASLRVKSSPAFRYKGEIKIGRPAYILSIQFDDISQFLDSPRLLGNFKPRTRSAFPKVEKIEFIGHMETQCIAVSHPKKTYITDGYVKTHNTTMAMNIASNVVLAGGNVLVFSAESTRQSLMDRLISSVSQIPLHRIKQGNLEQEDWTKLEMAVRQLKGKNLMINDVSGINVERVGAIARKRHRQNKLSLIVIDYLQLLDAKAESETHRVSKISSTLKRIAKQTGAPVVAVAQLNRGVEGQSNKRPMMKDLKQSGQIEQDADLIMMLYRDEYYDENSAHKGIAELIIGKQRDGETGTVFLASRLECNRFDNLRHDAFIAQEPEPAKRRGLYQ